MNPTRLTHHILNGTEPKGRIPSKEEVQRAKIRLAEIGDVIPWFQIELKMEKEYLQDVIASAEFYCKGEGLGAVKCSLQCADYEIISEKLLK